MSLQAFQGKISSKTYGCKDIGLENQSLFAKSQFQNVLNMIVHDCLNHFSVQFNGKEICCPYRTSFGGVVPRVSEDLALDRNTYIILMADDILEAI